MTHVLVYPFPSSGHVIPLLDLAKRLVSRGLYVTVLITPANFPLLQPLLSSHAPFLQSLLLPSPQFPNPKLNSLVHAVASMRQLHYPILLSWAAQAHPSPPLAIISDFFLGWTNHLARDLHVPRLVFSPSGAFAFSVSFSLWRHLPQNHHPDNPNSLISFPNIPNSPVYPWWQINQHYTQKKRGDPEWELQRENLLANLASWGVVFNTFTQLEQVYLDHMKIELGHDRVWAVGPVLPPKDDSIGPTNRGGSSSVPCHDLLTWLDSRRDNSVIYVCFGSRTVLSSHQMEVLTNALELSGVDFILSVRDPDERHVGRDNGVIPEEFEDRVRGRGLVIKGWAPQLAILGHRAVGSFLTHCGWNSVLEGMAAGVLMVTWPMGSDQFTNAELVVDKLGAGVRAAEGTQNVPDAKELGTIIKTSLEQNSAERIKAKELQKMALEAIEPEGSSQKQLDALDQFRAPIEMSCVSDPTNKRLKTQIHEDSNPLLHLPQSPDDNQSDCCGICYTAYGVSIRGEIDCCNHYFCFVCILEWSKHESRCPICRQRFSTVRLPPKPGVFPSSRLVRVPLRDQVYHVNGNLTTGPVDPYAETQCSVCNGREDESFLLLCDLCNTASHTYCVGLGYIVPEGDWFCHDCTVSRATKDSIEIEHQYDMPTAESSVTILDIVREPDSLVIKRPRPSPSVIPLPDRVNRNKDKNPDSGARTLHRCRNVQRSIQALRENWNALRSGSLRFYSISSDFGVTHDRKQASSYLVHEKSSQLHSLASTSLQHSTSQGSPSSNTTHERASKDVDKAWKMMERAKMMQKTKQRTSILPEGLNHPSRSAGAGAGAGPRKASSIHCNDQELKVQLSSRSTRMGKQYNHSSLNNNSDNHWLPKLEEENLSRVTCKEMIQHIRGQASQGTPCHENRERNFSKEQSRSCLITSGGSASSHVKCHSVSSSSKEVDEKKRLAKSLGDVNTSEDAKNEIKSLVKLNLKVLNKDKRLGVDAFKEVARQSTHTILASCRSEHPKSDTISSSSVCSYCDNQQFHKSTLMPNCCRQCFYMFVKNVVNSIMMQKLDCAGSSPG
ncbi:flavonol 3-O-glucosyltransferase UGT89B1-like [Senna tora]|uniref:Flavonol 3-O-glucosyltransferase UGT89B1-like n=1 Tax=Senna tora TaxID=362788 RepID=A0A834W262_9FABA|nr:flavonol 3-O-glucosyltransferase UGT89B1-like [Senna tora]